MRATLLVAAVLAVGCGRSKEAAPPPQASVPSPAVRADASAQDIVARAVCDWYWRSSSTNARPYDSIDQCIAAETKPRNCDAKQAEACATFARAAQPGTGKGLHGSADCTACLSGPDPALAAAFAEERAALERAKLTVHSARLHAGAWPEDLERDANKVLVVVDVELAGFGYRIDPDDFLIVAASGAPDAEALSGGPYTERLTRAGKPVAWTDPAIVDDPDLRMRAFFPLPKQHAAESLAVEYNGKRSQPFRIR